MKVGTSRNGNPTPTIHPVNDVHLRNVQGITWYCSFDCLRKEKKIDKTETKVQRVLSFNQIIT